MSLLRWVGFAAGIALLLGAGSSVIKTLLIPPAAVAATHREPGASPGRS